MIARSVFMGNDRANLKTSDTRYSITGAHEWVNVRITPGHPHALVYFS
ncbi:hypothetical protein NTGZN8_90078 [Candidatus Nitrotoga fabula]|uniref:Uncharacterized protein n=1 Tax=Candidatus Nitrotoga fabula TaxID=2182327 RepID=A0A916FBB2_9PROT|nr:hypothetical protein NTGZN8_90078 [Candidatus Nitrotoga fabula]